MGKYYMTEENEYYVSEDWSLCELVNHGPVYALEEAVALAESLYGDILSEAVILAKMWDWDGSEHTSCMTYEDAKSECWEGDK